ncbi:MAG: winged helix-turn-helix transcriptional regulator [Nitrospiraceae bacterium]|mgnify:CR=1 FL=1|nr:winged helix-turn-helix transcriptional regulator [Nitrospiraceae bacterium]
MKQLPLVGEKTVTEHITVGLLKIAMALRSQAWDGGTSRKLTPTQGHILTLLADRAGSPVRLGEVAEALAITAATASDAVKALERKKLVHKARSNADSRALVLSLTAAGRREARHSSAWNDVLQGGLVELAPEEQRVFLRGLSKVICSLQEQGAISIVRMCAGCRYFRPYVHGDSAKPHHCVFVDRPMDDGQLRLDCREFAAPETTGGASARRVFLAGPRAR